MIYANNYTAQFQQFGGLTTGDSVEGVGPQGQLTTFALESSPKCYITPCVQLGTASGASCTVSFDNMIQLKTNGYVQAAEFLGRQVLVRRGGIMTWEVVTSVTEVGELTACVLPFEDANIWTSDIPGACILVSTMKASN